MTIFALSSAPGRAAVAVIRVSGPAAGHAVERLTGRDLPAARSAVLRRLRGKEAIDNALVLWFPGPATVTGEDVAEFQVHGGRAVVNGVLDALASLPGLRPAEPGEFTRRAVLNGTMDLVAAEAVADLVSADTSRQRDQALEQLQGGLSAVYDGWRERLVERMARLEAVIDFPDEEIPEDALVGLSGALGALEREIRAHLDDRRRGERLREGLSVVILGAPNVGKSSLLNALAGTEAAIVSEEEGTTRDTVHVAMDIAGFAVTVIDTAGLREAPSRIEGEGIRRASKGLKPPICGFLSSTRPAGTTPSPGLRHIGARAHCSLPARPISPFHRPGRVRSPFPRRPVRASSASSARWRAISRRRGRARVSPLPG